MVSFFYNKYFYSFSSYLYLFDYLVIFGRLKFFFDLFSDKEFVNSLFQIFVNDLVIRDKVNMVISRLEEDFSVEYILQNRYF